MQPVGTIDNTDESLDFGKPAAQQVFDSNVSSRDSSSFFFAYLRNTTDLRIYHPGDGCSGPALVHYQSLLISSGLFRTTPPIVRASVSVHKTISCVWLLPQERPKIAESALSTKARGGQTRFVLVIWTDVTRWWLRVERCDALSLSRLKRGDTAV